MRTGTRLGALLSLSAAAYLGLAALTAESAPSYGDKKEEKKQEAKDNTVTVTATAKEKAARVKLAKGKTLVLRLPSNPTTGFSWQVTKINYEKLKVQGKPVYELPKTPRPGAGGVEVFRFTAEMAGTSQLEFAYRRPFEKNTPPARTFTLTVEIQ